MLSLAVPPGRYFVTANLGLEASVAADVAECRLINGHGGSQSEATEAEQALPQNAAMNLTIEPLRGPPGTGNERPVLARQRRRDRHVRDIDIVAVEVQQTIGPFGS